MNGDDEIGSVGEEAAKLLNALQDWAKESGGGHAATAQSAASSVAAGLRNINEHVATGSAECLYCPICRMVDLVRSTSPEVKAHLSVAASSLLQAAAGALATHVPAPEGRDGVQKIDLDDAAGDDEAWDD